MTKADLIDEVSRLAELTRKDSEVIVETIFDSIVRSLRVGDKIEIRGFGSFRTRQRKPRVGRNPKTGDRVEVPAKKIPFFKPSKELKDLVKPAKASRPRRRRLQPRRRLLCSDRCLTGISDQRTDRQVLCLLDGSHRSHQPSGGSFLGAIGKQQIGSAGRA